MIEDAMDVEGCARGFGGVMTAHEACQWSAGDFVNRGFHLIADTTGDKRERRSKRSEFMRLCAELGVCTKARVYQLARVAGTWGNEQRYGEIPWTIYRATLGAAKRLQRDPRELIEEVRRDSLSVAQINAMGKVTGEKIELRETCDAGHHVHVWAEGQAASRAQLSERGMACPACVILALSEGRDWNEAPILGVMG